MIGEELGTSHKYTGAVLADSGIIYAIPGCAARVLAIDPSRDECRMVGGDLGQHTFKYEAGCKVRPTRRSRLSAGEW